MNGILIGAISLLLIGCSTVTKEKVNKIPLKGQISKTLMNENYKGLKRKVAIARFTNETRHGSSFLLDKDNNRVGKQAMDILSARLSSTGKFIMMERSDMKNIENERKRSNIKTNLLDAEYLIVGSVSEFGRSTVSEVGVFSRNKKQKVYAKVNVRLLDVKTGEIVFSEEGEGEAFSEANSVFGVGAKAGYDESLNDKALSASISKLVSNLIENLMDKPWESRIISKQNGMYILAGGKKQGVKTGDIFSVVSPGRKVKNPQTGIDIVLPGSVVGKLKVIKLAGKGRNEISICMLEHGKLSALKISKLIVREVQK
ncbi:MAG: curli production assembly protein CsgG [Bacteriovorax sp. MedPE-SWde]|nr:MAG: curli production assembly protein CsgG [Bacteriovorax sp. MedPE-SWde]